MCAGCRGLGGCAALCPAWALSSATPTCRAGESGRVLVPPSGQGQTCLSPENHLAAWRAPRPARTSPYLALSSSEPWLCLSMAGRQAPAPRAARSVDSRWVPRACLCPPSFRPTGCKGLVWGSPLCCLGFTCLPINWGIDKAIKPQQKAQRRPQIQEHVRGLHDFEARQVQGTHLRAAC